MNGDLDLAQEEKLHQLMSELAENKAEVRSREKGSVYFHLILYFLGNIGIFIANAITSWKDWWFHLILIGWTIGILIHFLFAIIFDGIIAKYMDWQTGKSIKSFEKKKEKKMRKDN